MLPKSCVSIASVMIDSVNPEIWQISSLEISVRIIFAMVAGGLIGFEREMGHHPAGFRTHILVCVGSALIVLLSTYGFSQFAYEPNVRLDPARLAAQVISGIGFLGAGTILRTGLSISGLTTAASLWVVAAIGLAIGAGFYYGAIFATVMVVIILFFFNHLEMNWIKKRTYKQVKVILLENYALINILLDKFNTYGIQVNHLKVDTGAYNFNEKKTVETAIFIELSIRLIKPKKMNQLIQKLMQDKDVLHIEVADLSPSS